MTIQQLKYVIAITEAGSYNKAADMLYLSQPTLTNSVRELEKELGGPLFKNCRNRLTES